MVFNVRICFQSEELSDYRNRIAHLTFDIGTAHTNVNNSGNSTITAETLEGLKKEKA